MEKEMEMNRCKNCSEPIHGNYCSNCGQPANLSRVDRQYVVREIASAFYAERGMLYTIKKMLISPGKSIRQYITGDKSRYVKPITYLIITSVFFTLVHHFLHLDADYYLQQPDIKLPTVTLLLNWIIDNHGHSSIISGLIVAFWLRLFFKKSGYNLYEIFILMCFVVGTRALFSTVVIFFQGFTQSNLRDLLVLILMSYSVWAIGQFFDGKKVASYMKALLSYILALFTLGILAACIGLFIDTVMNAHPY